MHAVAEIVGGLHATPVLTRRYAMAPVDQAALKEGASLMGAVPLRGGRNPGRRNLRHALVELVLGVSAAALHAIRRMAVCKARVQRTTGVGGTLIRIPAVVDAGMEGLVRPVLANLFARRLDVAIVTEAHGQEVASPAGTLLLRGGRNLGGTNFRHALLENPAGRVLATIFTIGRFGLATLLDALLARLMRAGPTHLAVVDLVHATVEHLAREILALL